MLKTVLLILTTVGMLRAAMVAVPDSAALAGALETATAGDTLALAADDYGSVTIRNTDTGFVTLTSADGECGAVFGQMNLENAAYIRLDGLRARVIMPLDTCRHIDILNCIAGGAAGEYEAIAAIRVAAGVFSDIRIEGNRMRNAINGSQVFGCSGLVFRDNVADSVRGDSYKFGDITDGLIENNWGARYYVEDSLAHHDFMQWGGGLSKNVIIRGNVNLVGTESSQSQGIFGDKPTYENLLIENNIIYTGAANGISVSAGTLITVRNNTVLTMPGNLRSAIIVPDGAVKEYNIQAHQRNAGVDSAGNYIIQQVDSTADYYYNDYYENAMVGQGATIEDLRPVPGSPADGVAGAYERIYELLGGTTAIRRPIRSVPAVRSESGEGVTFNMMGRCAVPGRSGIYIKMEAGRPVPVLHIDYRRR